MDHMLSGGAPHIDSYNESRSIERPRQGRCAICECRLRRDKANLLVDAEELGTERQFWYLCYPCFAAVEEVVAHSTTRSAFRVRIAVGIVAADRSPSIRHEDMAERLFSYLLPATIASVVVIHIVVFLLIAMIH
jgi:hypothetical protein